MAKAASEMLRSILAVLFAMMVVSLFCEAMNRTRATVLLAMNFLILMSEMPNLKELLPVWA
jgi:hypothetical protein